MIFIVRVSDSERLSYSHKIFIDVKNFDSMKIIAILPGNRQSLRVISQRVLSAECLQGSDHFSRKACCQ